MKVCTDACLFGAFAADKIENSKLKIEHILDIGCGTGLLSLMLAQKLYHANIDAVEINEAAAKQTKENFDNSEWKKRLQVYHNSIQNFTSISQKKYDLIICNPPFYENDLKSENEQRNLALHSNALSFEELISTVKDLLNENGNFFVLLPYNRTHYFESLLMKHGLFVKEKVFIKQTLTHNFFRSILWINRNSKAFNQLEIIIMNEQKEYSNEFIRLLKDYYLNL